MYDEIMNIMILRLKTGQKPMSRGVNVFSGGGIRTHYKSKCLPLTGTKTLQLGFGICFGCKLWGRVP